MAGKFEALLQALSSGGTAGFADEIDGAIGGVQRAVADGENLGDAYRKERDGSRAARAKSAEDHPVITGIGEGVGTGLGVVASSPLAALGVAGKGAVALGGALEGLGRTEDDSAAGKFEAGVLGAGAALTGGEVLKVAAKAGPGALKKLVAQLGLDKKPGAVDGVPADMSFDFLKSKASPPPLPKTEGPAPIDFDFLKSKKPQPPPLPPKDPSILKKAGYTFDETPRPELQQPRSYEKNFPRPEGSEGPLSGPSKINLDKVLAAQHPLNLGTKPKEARHLTAEFQAAEKKFTDTMSMANVTDDMRGTVKGKYDSFDDILREIERDGTDTANLRPKKP